MEYYQLDEIVEHPPESFEDREGNPAYRSGPEPAGGILSKGLLLDRVLHAAARKIIWTACETLLPEEDVPLLELLSGPHSLLPETMQERNLYGISACSEDLHENPSLRHRLTLDLNRIDPLPFEAGFFGAVVCLFGVETLRHPERVFREVARVLRPGGVFLVVHSGITDLAHTQPGWSLKDDQQRLGSVVSWFDSTGAFGPVTAYGTQKKVSINRPAPARPLESKTPIWVCHASRMAEESPGDVPWGDLPALEPREPGVLTCPYCGDRLKKWAVPQSPFEIDAWYDTDYLQICFNDDCPYFQRGWKWMWATMKRNISYRHMVHPITGKAGPMPVPTAFALRDGIIDEPEQPAL